MFFERPKTGERAILVHIDFMDSRVRTEDPQEFELLVISVGGMPVSFISGSRAQPEPRTFIGSGKVDEIRELVKAEQAEVVIFNHQLSPSQERNLEREFECRVVDRTGLILDIFAQRARTHEGKLQVELAQLEHMSTRLVRGWTHLERQKGGIGLRGPGETQLETDRRLVRARIRMLHKRLEKVRAQREQSRRSRKRNDIPQVALVGYTNAGKSTLFNSMTDAETYAADKLFATLDPTLRRISVPEIGAIVVVDTVGFIRHLPHQLVESFRATLEETRDADLLLHIVDCAAEERDEYIQQVNAVLSEIDALKVPTLMIFNKIDLLGDFPPKIERNEKGEPVAVWLSAKTHVGVDLLKQAIGERLLGQDWVDQVLTLQPKHGRIRAQLFAAHAVLNEEAGEHGETLLRVRLPRRDLLQILKRNEMPATEIGFNDKPDTSRYNNTSSDLDGENHGVE